MALIESQYTRFPDRVFSWESLETFVEKDPWESGIHRVTTQGSHWVDILLRGEVRDIRTPGNLPVFFNGAVDRSVSAPPYFSGSSLAVELGMPVIAVADPTLNLRNDLGIGWYLGAPGAALEQSLLRFFAVLRERSGRSLVFVGGSAGGYASLRVANATGNAAFVWNPQIDLLRYASPGVRPVLATLTGDSAWERGLGGDAGKRLGEEARSMASERLSDLGLEHHVGDPRSSGRVLYLQNETDWHLRSHALPYVEQFGGSRIQDQMYAVGRQVVVVGGFNTGHRAPHRMVVAEGLRAMLDPAADPATIGMALRELAAEE